MSKVDDAIVEIDAQLAILTPQYEGLKDYARLNIKPETVPVVQAAIARFDKRVGLLATVKDLMARLIADGHPTLDVEQVAAGVYADLAENHDTIAAALALFASDPAVRLALTADPPEAK
jgi:hypothetical protein